MTLVKCQESLNLEFKDNVCRGCLIISPVELSPIDETTINSYKELFKILIFKDSKLPHRLCNTCLKSLKHCVSFKNRCQHADKILSELLQTSFNYNSRFDLNDLRIERRKIFGNDNAIKNKDPEVLEIEYDGNIGTVPSDKGQNSFHEIHQDPLDEYKPILGIIHGGNDHSRDDSDKSNYLDHACPEKVYKEISNNFLVIDSNPLVNPIIDDDDDHDTEENSFIELMSIKSECGNTAGQICVPNLNDKSRISVKIKKELSDDGKLSITNDDKITKVIPVKRKRKSCRLNSKQKSNTKTVKKFKNKLKLERDIKLEENIDENKPRKRKSRVVYCSLDESNVKILKLSVEEQLRELQEARTLPAYLNCPYKCEHCAKGFVHELSLQGHLVRHDESSGSFVCGICQQRYPTERSLRSHSHGHEDRFECKKCGIVVTGRARMARHFVTHNEAPIPPACKICGHISKSLTSHYRHVRHHNAVRFKCPQCPKTFKNKFTIQDHVARAHTAVKAFQCPECVSTFSTKNGLRAHALKHSMKRDFYCVECDMSFKTQIALTHHLTATRRHGDPATLRFRCEKCDKRYESASKLRYHMDCAHLFLFKFQCDKCPAKFQMPGYLKKHIQRLHEGRIKPRNFTCSFCGKGFTCGKILKNHILIHTGEKPHSCNTCGRPFRQKSALDTHIKLVHLNIKRPEMKRRRQPGAIQDNNQ